MLERLGLDDLQEKIYFHLLDASGSSFRKICQGVPDATPDDVRRALSLLFDARFVISGLSDSFSAVPPNVAIPSLIKSRADDAAIVTNAIPPLLQRFWDGQRSTPGLDFIEMVTVREQIIERWIQLDTLTQHTVRAFDTPPYVTVPTEPNAFEEAGLARGVQYRIVYAQQAVDIPGRWPTLLAGFESGEQARLAPTLPAKITLFDDWAALISLSAGDTHIPATVMIVHESPLLLSLQQLFESVWEASTELSEPLRPTDEDSTTIVRSAERKPDLFRMLLAGLSDDNIHHALQLSPSTVQRRVRTILRDVNAQTRFQAGYQYGLRQSRARSRE